MKNIKIVIVDDDPVFLDVMREKLRHYDVTCFSSTSNAVIGIQEGNFDIAIIDYIIDNMDGQQLVQEIRKFNDRIYIILLTGQVKLPGITLVRETEIQDYVEKNSDAFDELILRVESAVKSVILINKKDYQKTTFAQRLKHLRESYSISQGDLAEFCGIKRQQISNYEIGQSKPSIDIAEKLADYFDVSLDFLLCRTNKRK
ncbi:MAG: response regulator [Clostridiaceae bacterium]|nr:response regulator [Clostridiaceae bacterium]